MRTSRKTVCAWSLVWALAAQLVLVSAQGSMAPGVVVVSDPVDLDIPALADVAVSLYFPGDTGQPT